MPVVRISTSTLGKYLLPKVKSFMEANAAAMKSGATEQEGQQAIAEAIAYTISAAWSSPIMATAFAVGVVPLPIPPSPVTPGNPAFGSSIHTAMLPSLTEA